MDGWREFAAGATADFAAFGDGTALARVLVRLLVAAVLGGALGYQRELQGKVAGRRTHMLVTVGAALFVMAMSAAGGTPADISRVIQGVITGIGFIGAGAILKVDRELSVRGLTTAADIWLATAVGVAVGLGRMDLALFGTLAALLILAGLRRNATPPANAKRPPAHDED